MNLESMQEIFEGVVEPETISEAYREISNGAHASMRCNKNIFEIRIGEVHASMSIGMSGGPETFKCNCGYKGKGFCKHFVYLFSALSEMVGKMDSESIARQPKPTLKTKIARSGIVPPEIKKIFQNFQKDFDRLWKEYLHCASKKETERVFSDIYITRNKAMKEAFCIIDDMADKKDFVAAVKLTIYCLFRFYEIVGYDNSDVLLAIEYHFPNKMSTLVRKAKAAEKREIWDFVTKALKVKDTAKVPQSSILKIINNFLIENFSTKMYEKEKLNLFDELVNIALADDNEYLARDWVVEYLWVLADDLDIAEDDLYHEHCKWWNIPAVRLNYLEHCMHVGNFFAAYTISRDCLRERDFFDDDEIYDIHRIVLGASYKLNKFDETLTEAKILAKESPESLLFCGLREFLEADFDKWPKIRTRLQPIFKLAYNNI